MKKYKFRLIITSIVTLLPILVGLLMWNKLPDQIPTHFDMHGVPDDWSSKTFAIIGLPLILLALHILCVFVTLNDPKKRNIGSKMLAFIFWLIPVISVGVNGAVLAYTLGLNLNMTLCANILVGLLFIILGNYMSKNRQNYTIGIRLPWTLNSEENWDKTHRLASKIWVLGGILMIANAYFQYIWILFTILIICTLIPAVYSFIIYKKETDIARK